MPRLLVYTILTTLALPAGAQQISRKRVRDPSPPGDTGLLEITPAPGQIPTSMKALCNASSLIVDATIAKVFPPRETSPGSLETDALISIIRILKGPPLRRLVISQRGGFRGDLNVRPAQYSLVAPGQHYILFLTGDSRPKIPPAPEGLPRYLITGIWTGLFYFENGHMRVIADEPDRLRLAYQGLSVDQIVVQINTAIKQEDAHPSK